MSQPIEPTPIKIETNDERELTYDSLQNLVANMGTNNDKRSHSTFTNNKQLSLDRDELSAMYRSDWLSGKVVDIIPDDMCREWREFKGECEPEIIEMLVEEENRLNLQGNMNQAHKWSRLFGTGFIIMSIDDGNKPDQPLEIDKIKLGGLRHLKVIDRHMIHHAATTNQIISDPMNENFGLPEFYQINQTAVKIHHSRVLRFDGVKLPYYDFQRNQFNSDSVLDRLYDSILNFNTTTNGVASMVFESNVDIVKVKGLMSMLTTADGENNLRKRFTLAKILKSFNNLMLLDNEENFEVKTNSFAGLPDLIDRFAKILAAATDIPATRLLQTSASGLNATGEGDMKNYYDMIRSKQINTYKPILDRFDKIMARSLGLSEDTDLKYKFRPLFQMTEAEQATIDLNNAQRDQIYLTNDVINVVQVAKELKQKQVYSNITEEDIEKMEELDIDFGETETMGETEFGQTMENGFNALMEPENEEPLEPGQQEETETEESDTSKSTKEQRS